jgi:hypothetical protein
MPATTHSQDRLQRFIVRVLPARAFRRNSFITATMPVRCHQEMKQPNLAHPFGFADSGVQRPDRNRAQFIPDLNCK